MGNKNEEREETALGVSEKQAEKLQLEFEFLKNEEKGFHKGTLKFLRNCTFPPEGSRVGFETFIEWSNFVHTLDTIFKTTKTHNPPKLAELLGIKPPSVYHAFAKGRIPQNWITKIDKKFNVSIDDLVQEIVDKKLSSMEDAPAIKGKESKQKKAGKEEKPSGIFDKMLETIGEKDPDEYDQIVGKIHRLYNKYK